MARSSVMDGTAFVRLFESWPDNESLSVKLLRLKTITLLAIALMLQPSDIAPLATSFHAGSGAMERFVLTTDQIQFRSDGKLDVTFLGIKNNAQRTGFLVTLPPNPGNSADPVAALRVYLSRTESHRCTMGPQPELARHGKFPVSQFPQLLAFLVNVLSRNFL